METQVCNHCFQEKLVCEFNWRYKTLGIRAATCRECKNAQQSAYYNKNQVAERDRLRRQKANNQAAIREYIWQFLLSHPCVDCGENDPTVLEFDHVRGRK
jgi:hypothetical protein